MTGRIITCDHRTFDLPPLTQWQVTYTGSVPCDSYTATFPYEAEMAEPLHLAAGFLAMDGETVLLRSDFLLFANELLTTRSRGKLACDLAAEAAAGRRAAMLGQRA